MNNEDKDWMTTVAYLPGTMTSDGQTVIQIDLHGGIHGRIVYCTRVADIVHT